MYAIGFEIGIEGVEIPQARMTDAVTRTLDMHDVPRDSALTVVIESDEAVRALNLQYRDVDAPTDILSFPADPLPALPEDAGAEAQADAAQHYLGDLIIAYPYTAHQAEAAGHALSDELVLLVLHGTLHLLGYDHDSAEDEAEMWETQDELLRALHAPILVPRFFPRSAP